MFLGARLQSTKRAKEYGKPVPETPVRAKEGKVGRLLVLHQSGQIKGKGQRRDGRR